MRVKVKVSKIQKPVLDKQELIDFIQETASDMQTLTIENAPEDTRTLKNHGIDKERVPASLYGEKVFLNTEAIRENYPDERQKKRPDGGYYGYYQEEGWTQNGVPYPGKFYFEKSYNVIEWEAENRIKNVAIKAISFK